MKRVSVLALVLLALSILPAYAEGALSNQDVVKMVAAGLGEEIVVAKVKEAPTVDFRLEVDDLVSLQKAGVSQKIVAAMLERKTGAVPPASVASPPNPMETMQEEMGFEVVKVTLHGSDGEAPLSLSRGEMVSPGFLGFGVSYMNYPGLHARIRTRDRRPTFLVKSTAPLSAGGHFLGKLDPDEDDGVRSLKVTAIKSGLKAMFGGGSMKLEPDKDWVLPFDSVEESPGLWRATLKKDLAPGEYGWYVATMNGMQGGALFGFGVD
jgi:hypothetical protein